MTSPDGSLPPICRSRTPQNKELKLEDLDNITQSPATSRRYLIELQEQLKSYREETRKKDELIQKLSSMEIKSNPTRLIDASLGAGLSAQSAKGELAALQVKLDAVNARLREKQIELETKVESITALKSENELLKEDNARLLTITESLNKQIEEQQDAESTFNQLRERNEYAISTIQTQYREAQERLVDLEGRLRALSEEKENIAMQKGSIEQKYNDFLSEIAHLLNYAGKPSQKALIAMISDMFYDNSGMKSRMVTLTEQLAALEIEQKANRETINRLVGDLGREQNDQERYSKSREELQLEIDRLTREKQAEVENSINCQERLDALQRVLNASNNELEEAKNRLARIEMERRENKTHAQTLFRQKDTMITSLAGVLSDNTSVCPPTEEGICERIRLLVEENKEQRTNLELYDQKIRNLTRQMEAKINHHSEMSGQAGTIHVQFADMKEKLKAMENELASSEILRDSLRADKEKFFRYMQKLAEIMKMDRINSDIGFDMIGEGLIARAEQLIRMEADTLADKSTQLYNMQRKIKQMKEQLESKDLHLDLLRKKMASLEEKIHGKSDLEKEKDEETMKVKKVLKQLEKTQKQVEDIRAENVNLKAQLLECSNLKITAIEQDKEIQTLERTLEKLERVRQKQAKKITHLKTEVEGREKEAGDGRALSESTVQALSSELRTTKQALEDTRRKEKQLLEFRSVIGRMLGLDVDVLAIPDYEIINRLERLIQAHQSNVYTAYTAEKTLHDLDQGFRSGEDVACRTVECITNNKFTNKIKDLASTTNGQASSSKSANKVTFNHSNIMGHPNYPYQDCNNLQNSSPFKVHYYKDYSRKYECDE